MESKKQPEIRFQGFEEDWEEYKLGDKLNLLKDGTHGTHKDVEEGFYLLSAKNIKHGQIVIDERVDRKISEEDYSSIHKNYALKQGDVLLTIVGSIGESAIIENPSGITFQRSVAYLRPKKELLSSFLYVIINGHRFLDELKKRQVVSAQPGIYLGDLSIIPIQLPSINEQEKIGAFFTKVDSMISLHQQELTTLKETKQGFLQKMFPKEEEKVPELRFSGFTDNWEYHTLGETLEELKSGLSRMLSNEDIGLPVVRANNINEGQLNMKKDIKYWYADDPQGANTENYFIYKKDILINFINSEAKMGTTTIVETEPKRNTIYTTNILRARTKENYDAYFWLTLTQTYRYKLDIKTITKPAVNQASFTTVDFKKLGYKFPSCSEQKKIGNFFKQLDDTIIVHQRELELLKLTKKAFLQKLFV